MTNYYHDFTDEQLDVIQELNVNFRTLGQLWKVQTYLDERLGKSHVVAVDFRINFLNPVSKLVSEFQNQMDELGIVRMLFDRLNKKDTTPVKE